MQGLTIGGDLDFQPTDPEECDSPNNKNDLEDYATIRSSFSVTSELDVRRSQVDLLIMNN